MSGPGDHLSVNPDGINQDGRRIYEAADYTDQIVTHARTGRDALGVPWGEKGDYSKQMQEILGVAEIFLWELLRYIAIAQRQAADGTLQTARNFTNAEGVNVDVSGSFDPRTHGGRR
ncbi:hypothetical protein [Nocardiopsis sp. CC223A]|uniref:hypothetical protein n=1 Tax=Nocardiopsis sp. CC223A TaxID=3044051 RepID=UPI00278BE0D5|nr:hypothetical protein [Nocardiopsis sp. CC223A]